MNVNVVGAAHNANQDFYIANKNYAIVADGCSGCKYSEVGARLTLQLFEFTKDAEVSSKFEDNMTQVIENIITMFSKYENDYKASGVASSIIANNFLFTILAVFEENDKFIVYMIGDGYIITKNIFNEIAYIHIDYDNQPPYIIYNYCMDLDGKVSNIKFKKYEFSKDYFTSVGVASDGITPIAEGLISSNAREQFENFLFDKTLDKERSYQRMNNYFTRLYKKYFADDVTICMLGGEK